MFFKFYIFIVILVALTGIAYQSLFINNLNSMLRTVLPSFIKNYYNKYYKLYTVDELRMFDGSQAGSIYLSILGSVFDVSEGKKHYSPGAGYHGFAGKDASRAFVSGDFTPSGLTSNIDGLNFEELSSIKKWWESYHEKYIFKGYLIGEFYDEFGFPTLKLEEFEKKIHDGEKKKSEFPNIKYPPCNYEWNPDTGSVVWCSNQSGGISRSWSGVPRKLYEPGNDNFRCVCINLDSKESNIKNIQIYKSCDPLSERCEVVE